MPCDRFTIGTAFFRIKINFLLLKKESRQWLGFQRNARHEADLHQPGTIKSQCPLWATSARGARGPVDTNILLFALSCNRIKQTASLFVLGFFCPFRGVPPPIGFFPSFGHSRQKCRQKGLYHTTFSATFCRLFSILQKNNLYSRHRDNPLRNDFFAVRSALYDDFRLGWPKDPGPSLARKFLAFLKQQHLLFQPFYFIFGLKCKKQTKRNWKNC